MAKREIICDLIINGVFFGLVLWLAYAKPKDDGISWWISVLVWCGFALIFLICFLVELVALRKLQK